MARDRSKQREENQSQAVQQSRGGQLSRRESGWGASLSPFSLMRRFADDMDRIFEDAGFPGLERFGGFGSGVERFSPRADMVERDGKLVVRVDLPGMSKEDVTVEVTENALMIQGERKYEHEQNEEGVYRLERSYGSFHREIPLPEGVSSENATATFRNGVLEIELEAPHPGKHRRRLEVQGEDKPPKPGQTAA